MSDPLDTLIANTEAYLASLKNARDIRNGGSTVGNGLQAGGVTVHDAVQTGGKKAARKTHPGPPPVRKQSPASKTANEAILYALESGPIKKPSQIKAKIKEAVDAGEFAISFNIGGIDQNIAALKKSGKIKATENGYELA